jgi:hypothetical protein
MKSLKVPLLKIMNYRANLPLVCRNSAQSRGEEQISHYSEEEDEDLRLWREN